MNARDEAESRVNSGGSPREATADGRPSLRRGGLRWIGIAALAVCCLGASCGNKTAAPSASSDPVVTKPAAGEPVDGVPGIDTSSLTDSERDLWKSLLGAMSSPCGDARSVGRCAQEGGGCRQCRPAARYLARLVTEGFEREEIEKLFRARYDAKSKVEIDVAGAPLRGSPMAPVTLIEFSDFECPYCGRAAPLLEKIVRERPGKIRFYFLNYPLSGHLHSGSAARAAVAAGRQGKFWEMHDAMFAHQDALEDEDLRNYAKDVGLEVERFEADRVSEEVQRAVEADRAKGEKLGVQGTPTIYINGRLYEGTLESLLAYIDEELEE
jgi:protein-disulfide isomerase